MAILLPLSPTEAKLEKHLKFHASRLRWPQYATLIWSMVTPEEWASLSLPDGSRPDPIYLWARLRDLTPAMAVVDLAREVELISSREHERLVGAIRAHLGSDRPEEGQGKRRRQPDGRRMVRSQLLGRYAHETNNGVQVHIWFRDGKYIARGSISKRRFGQTLGSNEAEAEVALREMLVSIDREKFVRPSEAKHLPLNEKTIPRLSVAELCNRFLKHKRALRGSKTGSNYRSRLNPLIEFIDRKDVHRKWPYANNLNVDFATGYRTRLYGRLTTRNGHHASEQAGMSPKQIRNCLETAAAMFNWAKDPQNSLLPPSFVNPFTPDIIGPKIRKDPIRENPLPMECRIAMVGVMDEFELCTLSFSLALPPRPDEMEGILISDVDLAKGELLFGEHLGGRDFNKGRCIFRVPIPDALVPILRRNMAGRVDGPLLCRREVFEGQRKTRLAVASPDDVSRHFAYFQRRAKPGDIQSDQDLKRLFRRMLRSMGGLNVDQLRDAFKSVKSRARIEIPCRYYDTRSAVTTDMRDAGVQDRELRYLTGHTVPDILDHYVGLRPHAEMGKYFRAIEPLLSAIAKRAMELGL